MFSPLLFDLNSVAPHGDIQQLCPAEFLAAEEALLDLCEGSDRPGFLTFWESPRYFVVLGYGKQLAQEVFEEECNRLTIPILRRTSGGGTVLQGPGCLNYSLVLPIAAAPELESITGANRYIMERTRRALAPLTAGSLDVKGHTDLTLDGLKISGNAQRRKRRCLLFHGSLLVDFDLSMISRTLKLPQLQPDYRLNRAHADFLTNFPVERKSIQEAMTRAWNASTSSFEVAPANLFSILRKLADEKYSRDEWNRRS